jgi:eukaryotic-like serine/threonine-protein kinase
MSLNAGTHLGPYEILASIGAGGMGEVYKARDGRLKRDVALKVLPESFAADPDRVRRFQLEAQTAGALNHPNILVVYDIGDERTPYLVSELLEGQTLRQRLGEGKLTQTKSIDIARQVAAGLAAAHDKGITHRDIKPENLFLTKDGLVKILDFGLAKVAAPKKQSGESDETITRTQATGTGAVIGTASYMSPEQVRAKPVDHRSDIFSLGCVLYEMLAGRRAFREDTAVETMNAILHQDPPEITALDAALPPALVRFVTHCLEKEPNARFQSARDLGFALESFSQPAQAGVKQAPSLPARRRAIWALAALIPLAAIGGVWFGGRLSKPLEPSFRRLTFRRGVVQAARFAPDNHTIVYSARWEDEPYRLFTVRDDSPESRPLGFSGAGLFNISSRGELALGLDLRSVTTFVNQGTLARAPFSGGEPRPMLNNVRFADWTPDGNNIAVIVAGSKGWQIQSPPGKALYQGEANGFLGDLRISPDAKHIAFVEHPTTNSNGYVSLVDGNGQKKTLTHFYANNIQGLAWSPKGDEVWFTGSGGGSRSQLRAVTLDGRERLISNQAASTQLQDISTDGRVLLTTAMEYRSRILFRGQNDARERELSALDWSVLRGISSDGARIVFDESGEGAAGSEDAYVRDVNAPAGVKLGPGNKPMLSADATMVAAISTLDGQGVTVYPVGVGETRRFPLQGLRIGATYFHPSNREILVFASEPGHGSRIYRMSLTSGSPRAFTAEGVTSPTSLCNPSPDGKYMPGFSTTEGRIQLFPIEGGEPRDIAGLTPADRLDGWSVGGKALYVHRTGELPAKLMRLDLETGKRELIREVAPGDRAGVASSFPIKVTPDGKTYAYSATQFLHELFLVEGLK